MNLRNYLKYFLLISIVALCTCGPAGAAEAPAPEKLLNVDDFIHLAGTKDTEFETILIDELIVKYQKDLQLPADDLILSVKQQYDFLHRSGPGLP